MKKLKTIYVYQINFVDGKKAIIGLPMGFHLDVFTSQKTSVRAVLGDEEDKKIDKLILVAQFNTETENFRKIKKVITL